MAHPNGQSGEEELGGGIGDRAIGVGESTAGMRRNLMKSNFRENHGTAEK